VGRSAISICTCRAQVNTIITEVAMKRKLLLSFVMLSCIALSQAQYKKLSDVEGIGPAYEKKLEGAGVKSVSDFSKATSTRSGREHLAEETGISSSMLLDWANRIDLARIKGVGPQYADLLEASGVDSPKELAKRNPANLYQQLKKTNDEKKLVRKLPTEKQVGEWIASAKKLSAATGQ